MEKVNGGIIMGNIQFAQCGPRELITPLTQQKCKCADCKQSDTLKAHLENWVYAEARKLTEQTRIEQISKGAAKYEKPLGDADWTPEQLVHHAMQENVDQAHYLTMLLHEIEKLRKENERLKRLLNP